MSTNDARIEPEDSSEFTLTPNEVATRLKLSARYLKNLRSLGKGPVYLRLSYRVVRYRPADVDAWAKRHERGAE